MSIKRITGNELAKLFLSKDSTLTDAVRAIDAAECKIALVTEHNNVLLGVVTDGDIRRGLVRGLNLESPISGVMISTFTSVTPGNKLGQVSYILDNSDVSALPEIEPESGVVNAIFFREVSPRQNQIPNVAVIMAGGLGERMLHHTANTPKPLLKVGNSTLLDIAIEQCSKAGITRFYVSVNYLKNQIMDYLGDGHARGFEIKYLEEDERLGTAGALSLIKDPISDPFIVLNADVLHKVNLHDLLKFHDSANAAVTVGARPYESRIPFGVIRVENNVITDLVEKPIESHLVNAGIYALSPPVLNLVKDRKYLDMPDLIRNVMENSGKIAPYFIHEYWLDVGNPESLTMANSEWV